jgi:hypothetical protein
VNAITNLLYNIQVGEPVASGSMFMFPLYADDETPLDLLTLDEALAQEAVALSETCLDGSVPNLMVENKGKTSVFLLDGEQVLGLKQNRTFNLSMLLPGQSRTMVPVSCLERGRWSSRHSKARGAEHVHFARGRANKMRSVTESLGEFQSYRSDQGKVWEDIDCKFQVADDAGSSTSAEADYYASRRELLQPLVTVFSPRPKQVGVAIGVGFRLVGIDVFGTSDLYATLSQKLLKSYLLDALDASVEASPPPNAGVKSQIERLFLSPSSRYPAPGSGETLRWMTLEGAGAALVADGRCVHAMAFCDA